MENTNTKDWSVDDSDDELMLATEVDVDLRKCVFLALHGFFLKS
jgi:hypothetical protein